MRFAVLALVLVASPAAAGRTSLGTFEGWGAFRDGRPVRCFAIAQPMRAGRGQWQPFASVATWPGAGVRGQVHFRLGRAIGPGTMATLAIGNQRFILVASGADAWAADARTDAAIVAAMRSAPLMRITSRSSAGTVFTETYALQGAATAMDSASLGCARA